MPPVSEPLDPETAFSTPDEDARLFGGVQKPEAAPEEGDFDTPEQDSLVYSIKQKYPYMKPEGAVMSAVRVAKNKALPALGTVAGAAGAGLLSIESGPGAILAGAAGGAAGGGAGEWANEALMGKEGIEREKAQMALNQIEHPWASSAGGILPTMVELSQGGGLVKNIGTKAASKMAKELGEVATQDAGKLLIKYAAEEAEKEASKKLGIRIAENALAGARQGASEAAQRAVSGEDVGFKDFADSMANSAISFGSLGVLPHIEGFAKNLGMAIPQAYLTTLSNAAYESIVHHKEFNPEEILGKGAAEVIPFAMFNAVTHGIKVGQEKLAKMRQKQAPTPTESEISTPTFTAEQATDHVKGIIADLDTKIADLEKQPDADKDYLDMLKKSRAEAQHDLDNGAFDNLARDYGFNITKKSPDEVLDDLMADPKKKNSEKYAAAANAVASGHIEKDFLDDELLKTLSGRGVDLDDKDALAKGLQDIANEERTKEIEEEKNNQAKVDASKAAPVTPVTGAEPPVAEPPVVEPPTVEPATAPSPEAGTSASVNVGVDRVQISRQRVEQLMRDNPGISMDEAIQMAINEANPLSGKKPPAPEPEAPPVEQLAPLNEDEAEAIVYFRNLKQRLEAGGGKLDDAAQARLDLLEKRLAANPRDLSGQTPRQVGPAPDPLAPEPEKAPEPAKAPVESREDVAKRLAEKGMTEDQILNDPEFKAASDAEMLRKETEPKTPDQAFIDQAEAENAGTVVGEALADQGRQQRAAAHASENRKIAQDAIAAKAPVVSEPAPQAPAAQAPAPPRIIKSRQQRAPKAAELPPLGPKPPDTAPRGEIDAWHVDNLNQSLQKEKPNFSKVKLMDDKDVSKGFLKFRKMFESLFNRKIIIIEPTEKGKATFAGIYTDQPGAKEIFINGKGKKYSPVAVLGHEFMHDLANNHKEIYAELRKAIIDSGILKGEAVKAYGQKFLDANYGEKFWEEELFHNLIGDRFFEGKIFEELAKLDKPLFEKLLQLVREWIADVREKLKSYGTVERLSELGAIETSDAQELSKKLDAIDKRIATLLKEVAEKEKASQQPPSNAIPEPSTEKVLPRKRGKAQKAGGQPEGVGRVQQGTPPAGTAAPQEPNKVVSEAATTAAPKPVKKIQSANELENKDKEAKDLADKLAKFLKASVEPEEIIPKDEDEQPLSKEEEDRNNENLLSAKRKVDSESEVEGEFPGTKFSVEPEDQEEEKPYDKDRLIVRLQKTGETTVRRGNNRFVVRMELPEGVATRNVYSAKRKWKVYEMPENREINLGEEGGFKTFKDALNAINQISDERIGAAPPRIKTQPVDFFNFGNEYVKKLIQDGGLRSFDEVLKAVTDRFGGSDIDVRPYIPSWYSNARNLLPKEIRAELSAPKDVSDAARGIINELPDAPERDILGEISAGGGAGGRPGGVIARPELVPVSGKYVNSNDYSVGEGKPLTKEQVRGVNAILHRFITNIDKGAFLLADGTGFGKTAQSLATIAEYRKQFGSASKILIISQNEPILNQAWIGGAKKMGISLDGKNTKLTTYSQLKNLDPKWQKPDLIIWDEAHNLKNADSLKAKEASKIDGKHEVFVTATPMDRPHSAAYFLAKVTGEDPNTVAEKLGFEMKEVVNEETGEVTMIPSLLPGRHWDEIFSNIMAYRDYAINNGAMLRREYPFYGTMREDSVPLSEKHKQEQQRIIDFYSRKLEGDPFNTMTLKGNLLMDLRRWSEQAKIERATELAKKHLDEGGQVVLVVRTVNNQFLQPKISEDSKLTSRTNKRVNQKTGEKTTNQGYEIEGAATKLRKALKGYGGISEIHGSGKEDITDAVQKFQSGKNRIAIATPQSGGTGIELDDKVGNKKRMMIVLTPEFAGDSFEQLIGRVSRSDTKSPSEVVFLTNTDSDADNAAKDILSTKLGTLGAIQGGSEVDFIENFKVGGDVGKKGGGLSRSQKFNALLNNWRKSRDRGGVKLTPFQEKTLEDFDKGVLDHKSFVSSQDVNDMMKYWQGSVGGTSKDPEVVNKAKKRVEEENRKMAESISGKIKIEPLTEEDLEKLNNLKMSSPEALERYEDEINSRANEESSSEDDTTTKEPWQRTPSDHSLKRSKGFLDDEVARVDIPSLMRGDRKAIILSGLGKEDGRYANLIADKFGIKVGELPGELGWVGYLNEGDYRNVYNAYREHLIDRGDGTEILHPAAYAEVGKAMGVPKEDIADFYQSNGKELYSDFQRQSSGEEPPLKFSVEGDEPETGDKEEKRKSPKIIRGTIKGMRSIRKNLGMSGGKRKEYINAEDTMAAAYHELMMDPSKPERLVDEILAGEKQATPEQKALLQTYATFLSNGLDKAVNPSDVVSYMDKLNRLTRAIIYNQSMWGQAGNVSQIVLKRDYSIAGLTRTLQKAVRRTLTKEEFDSIRRYAKDFAALDARGKQAAFSYLKKVSEETISRLKKEVDEIKKNENLVDFGEAVSILDQDWRNKIDKFLNTVFLATEVKKALSKIGPLKSSIEPTLKFSELGSSSRKTALKSDLEKIAELTRNGDVKGLQELLGKLNQQMGELSGELKGVAGKPKRTRKPKTETEPATEAAEPPSKELEPVKRPESEGVDLIDTDRTEEEINEALDNASKGDATAIKILEDLAKPKRKRIEKIPDPVRSRFASEVRKPTSLEKFKKDMMNFGVSERNAELLYEQAVERAKRLQLQKEADTKLNNLQAGVQIETARHIIPLEEIAEEMSNNGYTDLEDVPRPLLRDAIRTLIARGASTEVEIMEQLSKFLNDNKIETTPNEVREYAHNYGDYREPSKDELDRLDAQFRQESLNMASLVRVQEGLEDPKKTGKGRHKLSQAARELKKKLIAAMKEAGINLRSREDVLASTQDAIISRLQNDIQDLKAQIDAGKRRSDTNVEPVYGEEFRIQREQLIQEKERLERILEIIDPKKPKTQQEREKNLIKAAKDMYEYYKKRLENKEFGLTEKEKSEPSAELKRARLEASKMKALFDDAQDVAMPSININKRLKARKAQLNALLESAVDRLLNGKKDKQAPLTDEQIESLQNQIKAVRGAIHELEADPSKDMDLRIKASEKSLERAIKEVERQLALGTKEAAREGMSSAWSPKISELHSELEELREQRDTLYGITKLTKEEIALKRYKTFLKNRMEETRRRIRDKDFSKKVINKTVLDEEAQKMQMEMAKLTRSFQSMVQEKMMAERTPSEKFWDLWPLLKRFNVLTSPVVFGKLAAASLVRSFTTALEEAASGVWSGILPKEFVKKAELEGGFSPEALSKFLTAKHIKQAFKDMPDTFKNQSELELMYSKHPDHGKDIWSIPGRLHAMMKAPLKRMIYEFSFQKLAEAHLRSGGSIEDINDPSSPINWKIANAAYKAANRGIFLQDNVVVDAWNSMIGRLEGKKESSGPILARAMKILTPIVRVPTNIVSEAFQYTFGLPLGLMKLAKVYRSGLEKLSAEEADSIMRTLKKGSLGAGLVLLGFYSNNPILQAGGYYNPDDKHKPGEPKVGGFRILGHDIPSWLTHSPAFEAIQFGATIRRALNKSPHAAELPAAAWAAAIGLAEETPFLNEMMRTQNLRTQKGRDEFFGELAKSQIEPELLQKIAQWTDRNRPLEASDLVTGKGTQARSPRTFWEPLKTGIPILRQQVSMKVSSPFSPTDEDIPPVITEYAVAGNPMPSTPSRTPLEKANGPISNEMWNAYAMIRGDSVKRQMLENMGYLMSERTEKEKRKKIIEISKSASFEARKALGLKMGKEEGEQG